MQKHRKLLRHMTHSTAFILILGIVFYVQAPTAQATPVPVSCISLSSTAPSGSTQYSFTVTAAGASNVITGYTFNFGDRQSYSFAFSPNAPRQNKLQATISHTYAGLGVYNASVSIDAKANGRTMSVTSAGCHATIDLGPTMTVLVDTGAGDVSRLFVLASLTGIALWELGLWLRRASR